MMTSESGLFGCLHSAADADVIGRMSVHYGCEMLIVRALYVCVSIATRECVLIVSGCNVGGVSPGMVKGKGKGFPYSIPSIGPGADPGVQAVSLQVTVSHPPGGRLPLLSARPAVTSPAAEHHRPLAGTKLYCLVKEAHRCKQLA